MEMIFREGALRVERRRARLHALIPTVLRARSLHEKLRWLVQLPFGYTVFVLLCGEQEIGYCFVSRGGSPRYPFARRGDCIVGPYYIAPEQRGHGYAAFLIGVCLRHTPSFRYA